MANCSAVSGPSGSGAAIEPVVLIAAATRATWARTRAKASHHQLASRSASKKDSRSIPPNAAIRA